MPSSPIVYVVDDDNSLRQSMEWLVESLGLQIASFASAQEFLDQFDPKVPGCLVVDVRMPGMSGLDLQQWLSERHIRIPVIVMTAFGDAQTAVRAMKGGAFDFIEKPFNNQHMIDLLQAGLAADAAARRDDAIRAEVARRVATLTARERQVMDLVVAGRSNKDVGSELGISLKTVEAHRAKVMTKMRARSFAELVMTVGQWNEAAKLGHAPAHLGTSDREDRRTRPAVGL